MNPCINIDLSNANHNTQGTTNVEAIHDTVYVKNPLLNSNQEMCLTTIRIKMITKENSHSDVIVGDTLNLSEDGVLVSLLTKPP